MGLWGRIFNPLKAGRSDIELSITAASAAMSVEIFSLEPEGYPGYRLSDIISRARIGVNNIARQAPAVNFIARDVFLDHAFQEINNILEQDAASYSDLISSLWRGRVYFFHAHRLLILINDYAEHNLTRARSGASRLTLDQTIGFNDTFRQMARRAFHESGIDPSLLDPCDFGLINWGTLELRRK